VNAGARPPRAAVVLAAAALAAKLAVLAVVLRTHPDAFVFIDTGTYLRPARALLEKGTFSPSPEAAPEPEINRTPGYPAILAATRAVSTAPWAPSVVGALFAFGTALATAALAARLFGPRAGVAAAAIVSLEPGSFLNSLSILSDTPFTFFLTLGISALAGFAIGERRGAAAAGLWLALATLVRPLAYYLLAPAAVLVWFVARCARPLRALALFLVAPVLLVGGWKARNLVRAGTFALSPIASSELLFYRAAPAKAWAEGVPLAEMQERLGNRERWFRSGGGTEREIFGERRYADLFPETSRMSLPELDARWRREALRILAEHPVLAGAAAARGAALLLLTPPSFIFGTRLGLVTPGPELLAAYENVEVGRVLALLRAAAPVFFAVSLVLTLLLAALWSAAAGGVRASWREIPAPVHAALLGTFLYVVAVSSGAESGDDRYRLPLVPIAAVYAARRLGAP
jgi:4-amino-4-deoxy-L-arabinose transferase-like glycosyltransferase